MNINTIRRIIVAAFITMLLCNAVAAYTYRPMPSRDDYKDYHSYRDAYTQRAMDDYQQRADRQMVDDRQQHTTQDQQRSTDDRIKQPSQDKCPDRYQQSEAKRKVQEQIEHHEQFPYGIPKQRERVSYGQNPSYNDLPDAYPNDKQTPSMHSVSVIGIIASMTMLLKRRTP